MNLLARCVESVKSNLRGPYHKARGRYLRARYGFGRPQLVAALRSVGVEPGDAVLLHCGMTAFESFCGTVADIVAAFEEAVGPAGLLMMPAFSMSGSALEFARSGRLFDPRTTPSQSGLITEVFRRSPGVLRSLHPTHSVSVWGRDAQEWIQDHPLATTPCGRNSPLHRLLERDGKIVLAGASIAHLTLFHCAEELLEARMPFSPFTRETFTLRYRRAGVIGETAPMRLFDPQVSRRRTLQPIETALRAAGQWNQTRLGTLTLAAFGACQVLATLEEMAARGAFCYRPAEPAAPVESSRQGEAHEAR